MSKLTPKDNIHKQNKLFELRELLEQEASGCGDFLEDEEAVNEVIALVDKVIVKVPVDHRLSRLMDVRRLLEEDWSDSKDSVGAKSATEDVINLLDMKIQEATS